MMDLGVHAVYIIGSYIGVAVVVAGVIGATWIDNVRQKSRLKALEASGMRRRGAGKTE